MYIIVAALLNIVIYIVPRKVIYSTVLFFMNSVSCCGKSDNQKTINRNLPVVSKVRHTEFVESAIISELEFGTEPK